MADAVRRRIDAAHGGAGRRMLVGGHRGAAGRGRARRCARSRARSSRCGSRRAHPLVTHTVRGLVRGFTVYLVPRDDGRLVCGATVEERGWDPTVTAGGAYELLRDVLALVPGLDDAELVPCAPACGRGRPTTCR